MPATLRLAERMGGNKDLASLQRELDSLRAYRDTLHDTMKGLVEHSQARLKPADVPELVASLKCVAAAQPAAGRSRAIIRVVLSPCCSLS